LSWSKAGAKLTATNETRFYITSLVMSASAVGPMIRAHRAVENSLHRVMDMVFRDDECRVRTDNAPANFATCRRTEATSFRSADATFWDGLLLDCW
jgi:predicted transposase YbfD/YdcC